MTLNLVLAKSSLALAALVPTSTAVHAAHPARPATPTLPRPAHRTAPAELMALTPVTARVRTQRTDGRVTLTFV
jgi:hypothetical protein